MGTPIFNESSNLLMSDDGLIGCMPNDVWPNGIDSARNLSLWKRLLDVSGSMAIGLVACILFWSESGAMADDLKDIGNTQLNDERASNPSTAPFTASIQVQACMHATFDGKECIYRAGRHQCDVDSNSTKSPLICDNFNPNLIRGCYFWLWQVSIYFMMNKKTHLAATLSSQRSDIDSFHDEAPRCLLSVVDISNINSQDKTNASPVTGR